MLNRALGLAVLATLDERGFRPSAAHTADDPWVLQTSAVLRQFWVTDIYTNKAANLRLIDGTWSNALDQIATDLRGACTG